MCTMKLLKYIMNNCKKKKKDLKMNQALGEVQEFISALLNLICLWDFQVEMQNYHLVMHIGSDMNGNSKLRN